MGLQQAQAQLDNQLTSHRLAQRAVRASRHGRVRLLDQATSEVMLTITGALWTADEQKEAILEPVTSQQTARIVNDLNDNMRGDALPILPCSVCAVKVGKENLTLVPLEGQPWVSLLIASPEVEQRYASVIGLLDGGNNSNESSANNILDRKSVV